MNILKKIKNFIWKSSADPSKTSATIKFALLGIIPYIMQATDMVCKVGYECKTIDPSLLEQIATLAGETVFLVLSLVSVIGTLYGAVRKVFLTVVGENRAIQ